MKAYKLTDREGQTCFQTQWGENVTHETDGSGNLCGSGWLHYYDDPILAVLLNPIHADFTDPRLWEAEAGGEVKNDYGLKFGCTKLTTVREIPLPTVTTEQRVRFAILCAKQFCTDTNWQAWADNWLNGNDRTDAAQAARKAWEARKAREATWAAEAAWAAARAAEAAATAQAAEVEDATAQAAVEVTEAKQIDLKELARQAMEGKL